MREIVLSLKLIFAPIEKSDDFASERQRQRQGRPLFCISYGLVLGILMLIFSVPVMAEMISIEGNVTKVRDGDTIEIGPIAIRLNGVSAPEMGEALGERSRDFMYRLTMGKRIRCELSGEKTYDRLVGICFLQGQDIGAHLISSGLALDCPRYSNRRYEAFEREFAKQKIELPEYCRLRSSGQN